MKAIYAGSFDPITLGHVSVIERASNLFNEIHIVVANNRSKNHYFNISQRTELVELSLGNNEKFKIVSFDGITADYINDNSIDIVIRGIRNATDLEYELQLEQYIRNTTKADTIYLSPYTEYIQTSSSLVRMFIMSGKIELSKKYITDKTYSKLMELNNTK